MGVKKALWRPLEVTLASESHLADAGHARHDPLVAAFPRHLAEEEVDLVVVWVEGVGNGMSGYESALWDGNDDKIDDRVVNSFTRGQRK